MSTDQHEPISGYGSWTWSTSTIPTSTWDFMTSTMGDAPYRPTPSASTTTNPAVLPSSTHDINEGPFVFVSPAMDDGPLTTQGLYLIIGSMLGLAFLAFLTLVISALCRRFRRGNDHVLESKRCNNNSDRSSGGGDVSRSHIDSVDDIEKQSIPTPVPTVKSSSHSSTYDTSSSHSAEPDTKTGGMRNNQHPSFTKYLSEFLGIEQLINGRRRQQQQQHHRSHSPSTRTRGIPTARDFHSETNSRALHPTTTVRRLAGPDSPRSPPLQSERTRGRQSHRKNSHVSHRHYERRHYRRARAPSTITSRVVSAATSGALDAPPVKEIQTTKPPPLADTGSHGSGTGSAASSSPVLSKSFDRSQSHILPRRSRFVGRADVASHASSKKSSDSKATSSGTSVGVGSKAGRVVPTGSVAGSGGRDGSGTSATVRLAEVMVQEEDEEEESEGGEEDDEEVEEEEEEDDSEDDVEDEEQTEEHRSTGARGEQQDSDEDKVPSPERGRSAPWFAAAEKDVDELPEVEEAAKTAQVMAMVPYPAAARSIVLAGGDGRVSASSARTMPNASSLSHVYGGSKVARDVRAVQSAVAMGAASSGYHNHMVRMPRGEKRLVAMRDAKQNQGSDRL